MDFKLKALFTPGNVWSTNACKWGGKNNWNKSFKLNITLLRIPNARGKFIYYRGRGFEFEDIVQKRIKVVVGVELKPKIPGCESDGLTIGNVASKQVGITADMA